MHAQWWQAAIYRPSRRQVLAQDIADSIRRRIVTHDIGAETRLPSVLTLAAFYGVSPPTVQAAVHILRALGYLRVAHGVGTFVRRRSSELAWSQGWDALSAHELSLMRYLIDKELPTLVARRVAQSRNVRRPRAVADLPFLASEREAAHHGWPERFVVADLAFHRTIAAAVRGAEATALLYGEIGRRLMPALMAVADVTSTDRSLDGLHREVATAILDGRPVAASRLSRRVALRELRSLAHAVG